MAILQSLLSNVSAPTQGSAQVFKSRSHEVIKKMNLNARRLARAEAQVVELRKVHAQLVAELAAVAGVGDAPVANGADHIGGDF